MIGGFIGKPIGGVVGITAVTFVLAAGTGSFALTGKAAILTTKLLASVGAFALSGNAANLKMPVGTGSFVLTGQPVTTAITFSAGKGTFALTGNNASLTPRLVATKGTFTLTGNPALFSFNHTASTGIFVVTGNPAPLVTTMHYDGPGLFFFHWGEVSGIYTRRPRPDGYKPMRVRTGQHTFSRRESRKW